MPSTNKPINSYYKSRATVLSYPVDLVDKNRALNIIEQAWQTHRGLHIVTINAEMIVTAQKDELLSKIVHQADLIIPDGAGVVLALKLNGYHVNRLPGIELSQLALSAAAKNNITTALLGSDKETLAQLYKVLPKQYPGLNIVFCQNGYFQDEEEKIILEKLAQSNPQLVLIAMGVPKQEYLISRMQAHMRETIFIGVGGSFDIWAGKKERAPVIWQNWHLEWLYRLIKEPWRFKRMFSSLPLFAWQVIAEYLKKGF